MITVAVGPHQFGDAIGTVSNSPIFIEALDSNGHRKILLEVDNTLIPYSPRNVAEALLKSLGYRLAGKWREGMWGKADYVADFTHETDGLGEL